MAAVSSVTEENEELTKIFEGLPFKMQIPSTSVQSKIANQMLIKYYDADRITIYSGMRLYKSTLKVMLKYSCDEHLLFITAVDELIEVRSSLAEETIITILDHIFDNFISDGTTELPTTKTIPPKAIKMLNIDHATRRQFYTAKDNLWVGNNDPSKGNWAQAIKSAYTTMRPRFLANLETIIFNTPDPTEIVEAIKQGRIRKRKARMEKKKSTDTSSRFRIFRSKDKKKKKKKKKKKQLDQQKKKKKNHHKKQQLDLHLRVFKHYLVKCH
eukprot:444719_1